jgi:hypothetical protein
MCRTGSCVASSIGHGQHYTSFEFGDLTLVSLKDGYVDMPPSRLRDESGKPPDSLPDTVPLVDGNLRLSVNTFLIDTDR